MTVLRSGKALVILAVALVLLIVVGVFLPAIASATVGRGVVADAVQKKIDGTAQVDAVSFAWGGPQRVRGLHIKDRSGGEVANVDVTVSGGLLALAFGPDAYSVSIGGELHGTLREDGSNSFNALVAVPTEEPPPAPEEPGSSAIPGVRVDVEGLAVTLNLEVAADPDAPSSGQPRSGGRIVLEKIDGHLDFTPGGAISVDLASPTRARDEAGRDQAGRVALTVDANGIVSETGTLTAKGGKLDVALTAEALPIPFDAVGRSLRTFELGASTLDLADTLGLRLRADTANEGAVSALRGDLAFSQPVRDDGTLNIEIGTISGEVSGRDVPTALLQPLFAGQAIVFTRDVGPTVDVTATFTPMSADGTAGSTIGVTLTAAPNTSLELTAAVTPEGAVEGGPSKARMLLQPALVASLIDKPDAPKLTKAVPLRLQIDSFRLPAPERDGLPVEKIAVDGRLESEGAMEIQLAPGADERVTARDLSFAFRTEALGERVGVVLGLVAQAPRTDASSMLRGELTIDEPLMKNAAGAIETDLQRRLGKLQGKLAGTGVPTALAAPFLVDTPIDLARDIGPTIDIDATFGPGNAGSDVDVTLTAAPNTSLKLTGNVSADGAVDGRLLDVRMLVQPALVAAYAESEDGPALEQPVPLHLRLDSFRLPAPAKEGGLSLADIAAKGSLAFDGALRLALGGETPRRLVAEETKLQFTSDALRTGVSLTGGAAVAGGRLEVDQRISNFLDDKGAFDASRIAPRGKVTLSNLDGAAVGALLGVGTGTADASALDGAIAAELAGGPVNLIIETEPKGNDLAASATLTTAGLNATMNVRRGAERLDVLETRAVMTLRPAVVAAMQKDTESPVTLGAPAAMTVTLDPFKLPAGVVDAEGGLPDVPIRATIGLEDTRLQRGAEEAFVLSGLAATVGASLKGKSDLSIKGGARLRSADGAAMGTFDCDLKARTEGERMVPRGTLTVSDIAVPAVEALLGIAPDGLTGWIGTPGTLAMVFTAVDGRQVATTNCTFPSLKGKLTASIVDDVLEVDTDGLAVTLRRKTLERVLNAPPESAQGQPVAEGAAGRINVAKDVPMVAKITRCRIPLGSAGTQAGAQAGASTYGLDASLDGGPLQISLASGAATTLDKLTATVGSDDLTKEVGFSIKGSSTGAKAEPGRVDVKGRLTNVLTPDMKVSLDEARLDMTAEFEHVPTMLADTALGLEQLLVAAVGIEMQSKFSAVGFSRSTGRIDGSINTPNGELTGAFEARPNLLIAASDALLRGSLAVEPPLRERLLKKINPILADIRVTEDRLRFEVTEGLQLPTDGDPRKLNGDFKLTIGSVVFKGGSKILGPLSLLDRGEDLPGFIEPIVVHMRNGVVTYDRFAVRIDKFTMQYRGQIDLPNDRVDLRTDIPLRELGGSFKQLKNAPADAVIPFVTRGTLEKSKTEMDPDFDLAKLIINVGVGGLIDDALKDKGGLGGVIGDLLGGKKKK